MPNKSYTGRYGQLTFMKISNSILQLILLISLFSSCDDSKQIDAEDIIWKNGIKIDSTTNLVLDGHYVSTSPIGGSYSGDETVYLYFENGIPKEKWNYVFNDDVFFKGEFLEEESLKIKIKELTLSKRVDIEIWDEGGPIFNMLEVDLIFPSKIDSTILNKIDSLCKAHLILKHDYKIININSNDGSSQSELFTNRIK
jgi:hypothetical protein